MEKLNVLGVMEAENAGVVSGLGKFTPFRSLKLEEIMANKPNLRIMTLVCPECRGDGVCPECRGSALCQDCSGKVGGIDVDDCYYCDQSGECPLCGGSRYCYECGGEGWIIQHLGKDNQQWDD